VPKIEKVIDSWFKLWDDWDLWEDFDEDGPDDPLNDLIGRRIGRNTSNIIVDSYASLLSEEDYMTNTASQCIDDISSSVKMEYDLYIDRKAVLDVVLNEKRLYREDYERYA